MTPLDVASAEIAKLTADLETARYELSMLRADKEQESQDDFVGRVIPGHFNVQPGVAKGINRLWRARGSLVTDLEFAEAINCYGDVARNTKAIVCRIRTAMGKGSITTVWGCGYAMSDAALKAMDSLWDDHKAGVATTPHRKALGAAHMRKVRALEKFNTKGTA